MKKIFTLQGDRFVPISSGRNYVFRQYESIHSFIKRNFKDDLAAILCKPIQSGESITFYTELTGDFRPIEELAPSQKQAVLIQYNAYVHTIHAKCTQYKQAADADYAGWADTLKAVFDHDSNMLFSDGTQLAIVWGWKFRLKANYYLPFESFSSALPSDDVSSEENPVPAEEEIAEPIEEVIPDAPTEVQVEEVHEPLTEEIEEPIVDEVPIAEPEPEIPEEPITINTNPSRPVPIVAQKHWFFRFLDAIERFAKRFWWLILILLAVLLFFLFRGCETKPFLASELPQDEQDKLYSEIMPEQPRHRTEPIDTTKFIDDEESHARIISDVVNIALKKKTQNFKHFAIELKHEFADEEYEVVYYDEETSRLQFNFPEEERTEIKETIRTKMAKYDLLIWDEAVFESGRSFNDPDFSSTDKSWYLKSINADKAWDITTGDTSVVIAVIDDGFDLDHVELRNNIVKRYNVVNDNSRIYSGPDRFHGTHVAGIALAKGDNGKGLSGIAPGCRLMPIQAAGEDGFFTMTDIIDGILYAIKHGADVINMSLGKQFSEEIESLSPSQMEEIARNNGLDEADFWKELFQVAEDNNVTIVLAGGNQNILVGLDPMQRSNQVIKVAATNKMDKKAGFSNFFLRSEKDCFISAPGEHIYSTVPGNRYQFLDGTSMASPVVAGAVGLMKSVNPRLTNAQIRQILRATSKPLSDRRMAPLLQLDKAIRKARSL
jgi:subtilisin family serine protease